MVDADVCADVEEDVAAAIERVRVESGGRVARRWQRRQRRQRRQLKGGGLGGRRGRGGRERAAQPRRDGAECSPQPPPLHEPAAGCFEVEGPRAAERLERERRVRCWRRGGEGRASHGGSRAGGERERERRAQMAQAHGNQERRARERSARLAASASHHCHGRVGDGGVVDGGRELDGRAEAARVQREHAELLDVGEVEAAQVGRGLDAEGGKARSKLARARGLEKVGDARVVARGEDSVGALLAPQLEAVVAPFADEPRQLGAEARPRRLEAELREIGLEQLGEVVDRLDAELVGEARRVTQQP